jgi:hypothetical protein
MMAQRPLILQSRYLRDLCPPRRSSKPISYSTITPSSANHPSQSWSLPTISSTVADDQVARLASKPLHNLTLSDLVRYTLTPSPIPSRRTIHQANNPTAMAALHYPNPPSSLPQTSPSPYSPPASPIESSPSAISPSSWCPTRISPAYTATTYTPSQPYYPINRNP